MKNAQKDLNLIISEFEELACYNQPGTAAIKAVQWLDEEYVLIPRETLPAIQHPSLDDAFGGDTAVRLKILTEKAYDGDTAKMRDIGYEHLVMADYLENKKLTEEEKALTKLRLEAWLILHPKSGVTEEDISPAQYEKMTPSDKAAVDAIVDLKRQLAEAIKKS